MRRGSIALGLVCVALATPSRAAVRICRDTISQGPFTAGSEADAKRQALEAWKAEAAKLGATFAGWGTATDRILACQPARDGTSSCIAAARPCTIEHAPNTLETRSKRMGI